MKSSNSHNADHDARKAEMMKRAQMAIDGRSGAVRYYRTTLGGE